MIRYRHHHQHHHHQQHHQPKLLKTLNVVILVMFPPYPFKHQARQTIPVTTRTASSRWSYDQSDVTKSQEGSVPTVVGARA